MQKRQTTSPFVCPPTIGRSVSSALSILRLLAGGGPSKLSAIASNLLSERMLSSNNDSIVPLSVWKDIYGNNRHLASCPYVPAIWVKLRSERLTYTFHSFQPSMLKLLFVYLSLEEFVCFDVLSAAKEASSRRAPSRFKVRAQSTFRPWYHRPFYTPTKAGGSHASWKLRIRSVCV